MEMEGCVCSQTREERITLLKINTEVSGLLKTLNSAKIFTKFKIVFQKVSRQHKM